MQRNMHFSAGEYYHIYNRGVDKRNIFLDQGDYDRFMALLYLANTSTMPVRLDNLKRQASKQGLPLLNIVLQHEKDDTLVDIGAYALMPNHFHLLVHERESGGISRFMEKLLTGYSMYFNKKYERSGRLFQGTFQSRHADSDPYLKYLFSYIHLNPIDLVAPGWKANGVNDVEKVKRFLWEYKTSSYPDYLTGMNRAESGIVNPQAFPDYFPDPQSIEAEINDFLHSFGIYE